MLGKSIKPYNEHNQRHGYWQTDNSDFIYNRWYIKDERFGYDYYYDKINKYEEKFYYAR